MTDAMHGTPDVTRLVRDFGLTRSVARTAVAKVWRAAKRVARDDLGITSVASDPAAEASAPRTAGQLSKVI
jgi:hypothetical protein